MIAALQTLAELLAGDPVTVDDVVRSLGTVSDESAGSVAVEPGDAAFTRAVVVRKWDTEAPAHVDLQLASPTSLDALAETFGSYREIVPDEGRPVQALFDLDLPGQPYTVALIASLDGDAVSGVILRRDVRL